MTFQQPPSDIIRLTHEKKWQVASESPADTYPHALLPREG